MSRFCYDEIIIQVGRKAEKLPARPITILANFPSPTEIYFENENGIVA